MNTTTEASNHLLPGDEICPRCGANEQATHHPLCQARDGTPSLLADWEIRGIIAGDFEIILRSNNCSTRNTCALCNVIDRMDAPLAASIEGTEHWVCLQCLEKAWNAPGIAESIDFMNAYIYRGADVFLDSVDANFERMAAILQRIAGKLADHAKAETGTRSVFPIDINRLPF